MAGGTNRHNEIAGSCYTHLRAAAKKSGCKAYAMEVKLFRYQSKRYLYPDGMVTCNPLDLQSKNGVRSPLIIVEVLSKGTREMDRSFKLKEYFKLPSLMHYLLIEQTECEVQHYRRREDQSWEILIYDEMDQVIGLPEINLELTVSDLYEGIEFGPEVDILEEEAEAYGVSTE
jgi:Uma2 family endonuclease